MLQFKRVCYDCMPGDKGQRSHLYRYFKLGTRACCGQGAVEKEQGAVEEEQGAVEEEQRALEEEQGAVEEEQGAVEEEQGAVEEEGDSG